MDALKEFHQSIRSSYEKPYYFNMRRGDYVFLYDKAYRAKNDMLVFVKTLTGKVIKLKTLGLKDHVLQVKLMLYDREGIPPEYCKLVFKEQRLQDHFTLEDYNIQQEDTLNVVIGK